MTYRVYYHSDGYIDIDAENENDMMYQFFDTDRQKLEDGCSGTGYVLDTWEVVNDD